MVVNRETLDEICEESCPHEKYCTLKEMVARSGLNDKTAIQIKCVEKFKYEESERRKEDIGWEEAWKLWVEKGYADKFQKSYSWDKSYRRVYKDIMNRLAE